MTPEPLPICDATAKPSPIDALGAAANMLRDDKDPVARWALELALEAAWVLTWSRGITPGAVLRGSLARLRAEAMRLGVRP